MKVLFPNRPLKARLPDPDYEIELEAARNAGFQCELYSLEDLRGGDAAQARPDAGFVWVEGKDVAAAWEKFEQLGHPAAIVKDFVKSAKHRWKEACFITAATERNRFNEILAAFLEERGTQFEKGIVLRRFHDFVKLADDIRGQPVHEEYRLFMWTDHCSPQHRQCEPMDRSTMLQNGNPLPGSLRTVLSRWTLRASRTALGGLLKSAMAVCPVCRVQLSQKHFTARFTTE